MQQRDGSFVFSPSDLHGFLECEHLTALELAVARRELVRLDVDSPQADLIRRKGEEYEAAHLFALDADGLGIARTGDEHLLSLRERAPVFSPREFLAQLERR